MSNVSPRVRVLDLGCTTLSEGGDSPLVDIIFVHGLQGHPKNTWLCDNHPPKSSADAVSESRFRILKRFSRTGKENSAGSEQNGSKSPAPRCSDVYWPEDLLPKDFPDARVLTFGYDSNVTHFLSSANKKNIHSHGISLLNELVAQRMQCPRRPIIFLAHSLGGIIVKIALRRSQRAKGATGNLKQIRESTFRIIFFGTPHRGATDYVSWGNIATSIVGVMCDTSPTILRALDANVDTGELAQLTEDFLDMIGPRKEGKIEIYSFQESEGMLPITHTFLKRKVVPDWSSGLDCYPWEAKDFINANHRNMCRFSGQDDPEYKKVKSVLCTYRQALLEEGDTASSNPEQSKNKHYCVPYNVSDFFTGRRAVISRMEESFRSPIRADSTYLQKRFVLYGLGGSGKTQIAIKYAQENRSGYWGIFWIDASSKQSAEHSFRDIAELAGMESSYKNGKQWLSQTTEDWLLIIDNADDLTIGLPDYFPIGENGHILITSRDQNCELFGTVGSTEIQDLERKDAITLFLKAVNGFGNLETITQVQAERTVDAIGCLALALMFAAALIRRGYYTVEDYIQEYCVRRRELMRRKPPPGSDSYKYNIFTTWEVSYEKLKTLGTEEAQDSVDLLHFLAFLHFQDVPEELFERAWRGAQQVELASSRTAEDESKPSLPSLRLLSHPTDTYDRSRLRGATDMLLSCSLIVRNPNLRSLSVHPLVRLWSFDRLDDTQREHYWILSIITLGNSIPWTSAGDHVYRRRLLEHVLSCLHPDISMTFTLDSRSEHLAEMISRFARLLFDEGQLEMAETLQLDVLASRKASFGENDPRTLRSARYLAATYQCRGRYKQAEELGVQVIGKQKQSLGVKHPDTLSSMADLAVTYRQEGRLGEAERLQSEVMQMRTEVLGEDHIDTLLSTANLGNIYKAQGRLREAETLHSLVRDKREELLGEENPATLQSVTDLAGVWSQQARWEQAERSLKQAITVQKRILGDTHPDVLRSMAALAETCFLRGKLSEAKQLQDQVFALRKRFQGEEHPDTLQSVSDLVKCYRKEGQLKKALALSAQVLESRERVLGEEHPDTLLSKCEVASIYQLQGRFKDAAELHDRALEARRKTLGEKHPSTLQSIASIVEVKRQKGQYQTALEMCLAVLDIQKSVLGEEHPDTLGSLQNLGSIYWDLGNLKESAKIHTRLLETKKRVLGEEHPDTLWSMRNAAGHYRDQGRLEEATKMDEEVLETRKRVLGEEHPDTLDSIECLGYDYDGQGRKREAMQLSEKVLEMRTRVQGEKHPDTLSSIQNLASHYRDQGRLEKATQMDEEVLEALTQLLGKEHPDTLKSMRNLANDYYDQGRQEEATWMDEKVFEIRKQVLGKKHPSTLRVMHCLAIDYASQGRLEEATEMDEEVLETRKQLLGEEHPETLQSMHSLAVDYYNQGRLKEATQMDEEVLETRKQLLGEEHPETLKSMFNLAGDYYNQDRQEEAIRLIEKVLAIRKRVLGEEHPDTLRSMQRLAIYYGNQGESERPLDRRLRRHIWFPLKRTFRWGL